MQRNIIPQVLCLQKLYFVYHILIHFFFHIKPNIEALIFSIMSQLKLHSKTKQLFMSEASLDLNNLYPKLIFVVSLLIGHNWKMGNIYKPINMTYAACHTSYVTMFICRLLFFFCEVHMQVFKEIPCTKIRDCDIEHCM